MLVGLSCQYEMWLYANANNSEMPERKGRIVLSTVSNIAEGALLQVWEGF